MTNDLSNKVEQFKTENLFITLNKEEYKSFSKKDKKELGKRKYI